MNNINLNYKNKGAGQAIIIMHGLFGMLDNWNTIGGKLANDYDVYLVDHRDHGKSPKSSEFNYNLLAEDLYNFCREHSLEDAHFIGHSMGGKTIMNFANLYPDMVKSLIVVDIAPVQYLPGHLEIFKAVLSIPIDQLDSRSEVDEYLAQSIHDTGVRQFLMKNLTRNKELGGFTWKANFKLLYENYDNILAPIKFEQPILIPSLFLKGADSDYIKEADKELIKHHFPYANVISIPNAGHWIHAEKPKELYLELMTFLKKF